MTSASTIISRNGRWVNQIAITEGPSLLTIDTPKKHCLVYQTTTTWIKYVALFMLFLYKKKI